MSAYSAEKYWRRTHMTEEERRDEMEEMEELKSWERIQAEAIGENY